VTGGVVVGGELGAHAEPYCIKSIVLYSGDD
jgi:hypothetical protein